MIDASRFPFEDYFHGDDSNIIGFIIRLFTNKRKKH